MVFRGLVFRIPNIKVNGGMEYMEGPIWEYGKVSNAINGKLIMLYLRYLVYIKVVIK